MMLIPTDGGIMPHDCQLRRGVFKPSTLQSLSLEIFLCIQFDFKFNLPGHSIDPLKKTLYPDPTLYVW